MATADLQERVRAIRWYHTMDLAPGVVTPGWFDLRGVVGRVPLPSSLAGLRVLDVGTWDGFWAWELERRGASVVALDVPDASGWDWPPRASVLGEPLGAQWVDEFRARDAGWRLAHDVLGSRVERCEMTVYEASPEELGMFDLVFVGSLLLHLRDPVLALARLRALCRGVLIVADAVELVPSLLRPRTPTARLEAVDRPWWWQPNAAALRRMVESAGFHIEASSRIYFVPTGPEHPRPPLRGAWRRAFSADGREALVLRARGIPHLALRARPIRAG